MFAEETDEEKKKREEDEKKKKEEEEKSKGKTYSEEELTEIVTKAVAKTIAKEREKQEEEMKKKEEEIELSKMSAEERAKKEFQLEQEQYKKEKVQWEREKLLSQAKDTLVDLKLPREFAKYLLAEDKEKTLVNINDFEKAFNEAVKVKVEEAFKENGREFKGKQFSTEKNPFAHGEHFNLTEQGKLWKEDPERARALMEASKK